MVDNLTILSFLTPKSDTFYIFDKSTVRQALEKMDYHRFTTIPIIDENGCYVNSLSDGDLLRFLKNLKDYDMKSLEMCDISMVERYRPYKSIKIDASMDEVINLIKQQNFIPVVDDRNTFIGIIRRSVIIEYLTNK